MQTENYLQIIYAFRVYLWEPTSLHSLTVHFGHGWSLQDSVTTLS